MKDREVAQTKHEQNKGNVKAFSEQHFEIWATD